jgi:hypothetical protein
MSITPEAMIDEQTALSASPGYAYQRSRLAALNWIRAACVLTDRDPLLPVLVR